MRVQFGLRVPMVGTPRDTGAYAARVEAAGFDFMWMPDTPLLAGRWRDVYMHLTCAALETAALRLGPGVTNPITRHPVTTAHTIRSCFWRSKAFEMHRLLYGRGITGVHAKSKT